MKRIGIIGVGSVGINLANNVLLNEYSDEILLLDLNEKVTEAHVKDLQDSSVLLKKDIKVKRVDYKEMATADIVVITASIPADKVKDRLEFLEANTKVTKNIVDPLMENNFKGIMILVSNPVDLMTYAAYKTSGLPKEKVIGSGTILDSLRLRVLLAQSLEVNESDVVANIAGEHGDSSVALYSNATIKGQKLNDYIKNNNININLDQILEGVHTRGYDIFNAKGETSFGVASSVSCIIKAIIEDEKMPIPITSYYNGVYISTKTVVGANGAIENIEIEFNEKEKQIFENSLHLLKEKQQEVDEVINRLK